MTLPLRAAVAALATLLVLAGLGAPASGADGPGTDRPDPDLTAASVITPRSAPAPGVVRVATYNVCKRTCGKGRFRWDNRRVALVNALRAADPDVLAVQEANTQRWRGMYQIDDVQRLVAAAGLQIASRDFTCTRRCTRGAHVFYNPARLGIAALPNPSVAAGMTGMSRIARTRFGKTQDRAVSWAFLTPHGSSQTTLVVSVHLPTHGGSRGERLRRAVARGLRPWADGLIRASGLPQAQLVIAGDFNSFSRRQPHGAHRIVADSGLIDGFAAPERVNPHVGTVNLTKSGRYRGFPPRPYTYYGTEPPRIDYVFASVPPLRHEVVLELTPKGTFDNDYRASDHNMVLVDLPLR